MKLADQQARRLRHEFIGTEHILLGLIEEGAGVGANVLKNLNIDVARIRSDVENIVLPDSDVVMVPTLPLTPTAKNVIVLAVQECRSLSHNYIGTEHLLLGLIRDENGIASQVLANLGLTADVVRAEVLVVLGQNPE